MTDSIEPIQQTTSATSTLPIEPMVIPEGQSRRSLINHLQSINPNMSGADMARLLGCSRENVRKILGTGVLRRSSASSTLHINLGEELRADIAQAAEGAGSISGWCRTLISLACFLKLAGVDPIVVMGMKAKEIEAWKSIETKEESK